MAGLLAIGVLVIWLVVVGFVTSKVAAVVSAHWRWLFGTVFFCALLVLPVADEIIGGFQFRALCEKNASQFQIGVSNPEGRTTKVMIDPSHRAVEGTAIPISHTRLAFHDVATGEIVVAFDSYGAKGGVFIRMLGISNNNSPLTIGRPVCSPEQEASVNKAMKFKVIN